ncbi:MAG: DNRLRE domain-containing protein, partial [Hadesarchaea archaeon]|nr:DNRLRE domain-containing protein [Hadesarchaea archaeon]
MKFRYRLLAGWICILWVIAGVSGISASAKRALYAHERTLILQKGTDHYVGVDDARLLSSYPQRNYGAHKYLTVSANNTMVSVLRFDLSIIPATARVEQAYLELYLQEQSSIRAFHLEVYRLLRPWREMEVTWNQAARGQPWGMPGADRIGVDREDVPITRGSVQQAGQWYRWDVTEAARRWVAFPEQNHGFVLRGDGSSRARFHFASSNESNVSLRPRLVIRLSDDAGPEPPTATPTPAPIPSPTATPTPFSTPASGRSWEGVSSWVYQLTNYPNNRLDQIAGSKFHLAV